MYLTNVDSFLRDLLSTETAKIQGKWADFKTNQAPAEVG